MLKIMLSAFGAALLALSLIPDSAQAQPTRVFVAAQGSDSNPCTFAQPCRSFQQAHDTVAAGGEIDVLDPAGYGMLTISKAISIQGHGFAGIGVTSGSTGITISVGASDAVSLNGLLIEGNGVGSIGILFNAAKSLVIENCVVQGLTGAGMQLVPTVASTMAVLNTVVSNIGSTAIQLVIGANVSGRVEASLRGVGVYNNEYGIYVQSGNGGIAQLILALSDSEVGGSHTTGVVSQATGGGTSSAYVTVRGSTLFNNGTAVTAAGTGANLRLAASTMVGNAVTYSISGGSVKSFGDNYIDGNGDGDPAPPTISKK